MCTQRQWKESTCGSFCVIQANSPTKGTWSLPFNHTLGHTRKVILADYYRWFWPFCETRNIFHPEAPLNCKVYAWSIVRENNIGVAKKEDSPDMKDDIVWWALPNKEQFIMESHRKNTFPIQGLLMHTTRLVNLSISMPTPTFLLNNLLQQWYHRPWQPNYCSWCHAPRIPDQVTRY
jgi:hypothetical protein